MKRYMWIVVVVCHIMLSISVFAQTTPEDWNAVYEAARQEGKVVIYSVSSRIFDAVDSFQQRYPGIKVEVLDMLAVDQIDALRREQSSGEYTVDVLLNNDLPTAINELLPQGMIVNYVPPSLLGGQLSADVIPEYLREPLLVHSMEAKVIFYNSETYPESPIDTLWDLTRPVWKGRVQMKDPMLSEENMNVLQTVVQHADAMEAAYQKEFGEPLTLSPNVENAGYEWILRLVRNDLALTTSDGDAAKAVGAAGQTEPPVTLSVASSKLRYNEDGMKLAVAWNANPAVGVSKPNFLVMAHHAPHPNAAKLLIRWLLGDAEGGAGMTPWLVPGGWPSRQDVPVEGDMAVDKLTDHTWSLDPDFINTYGPEVREFWMGL